MEECQNSYSIWRIVILVKIPELFCNQTPRHVLLLLCCLLTMSLNKYDNPRVLKAHPATAPRPVRQDNEERTLRSTSSLDPWIFCPGDDPSRRCLKTIHPHSSHLMCLYFISIPKHSSSSANKNRKVSRISPPQHQHTRPAVLAYTKGDDARRRNNFAHKKCPTPPSL